MAPQAITLMALAACCLVGMGHGAITYVVNSPVDSAPAPSCMGTCNVRTAWHMAQDGDTILIQVDPIMKSALSNWEGKSGKITFKGESVARDGGNVIVRPETGSGSGFIYFNVGFNYSITLENMDFEAMQTMPIYAFGDGAAASDVMQHNALAVEAHKARAVHPRPTARNVDAQQMQVIHVRSCRFRQNSYSGTGAIAVWAFSGLVAVHNCQFVDNNSGGNFGGAIFGWDVQNMEVKDTEFIRNVGDLSIVGGEIHNKFYIGGSTFQDNSASNMFTGYGVSVTGSLYIHSTSFLGNKVPSSLVWGGNFSATWVTATIAPDQSIVSEVGGYSSLFLDGCTFETLDGTPVSIVNAPSKIFNRDPGNLNLNSTFPVQTCSQVPTGPLPCPEGTKCKMVMNPGGEAIGYDCPIVNVH